MSAIRQKAIGGIKVGDSFTVKRTFTETVNGRICHGLLVAGMLTEIGGQCGWLASVMNFRFKKPVYFGDTIECKLTIFEIDEKGRSRAAAVYQNQDGVIVLEADLEGILPGVAEREVLSAMVRQADPTNKF